MNFLFGRLGRIFFALPLIVFGSLHFINGKAMAAFVLENWPAAIILVYIAGAGLILAGISFIINKFVRLSGILLAIELFIFAFAIQMPGMFNPQTLQGAMIGFLKDFALAGGALVIAFTSENKKSEKVEISGKEEVSGTEEISNTESFSG